MKNRDFNLLRPFDLEKVKAGAGICLASDGSQSWDYVAGPDSKGKLCLMVKESGEFTSTMHSSVESFRMAPLAWVEGKPVYEGDHIWCCESMAIATKDGAKYDSYDYTVPWNVFDPELWSWQPQKQKTKYKANMFAYYDGNDLMWRSKDASIPAYWKRIPSEDKQIEWEE